MSSFISPTLVAIISLFACLYMTGVIWLVQLVHYPLFFLVPSDSLSHYASVNASKTTLVVMVPMMAELISAIYLIYLRPLWLSPSGAYVSATLIVLIFASTFFIQVPLHNRMEQTGDVTCVGKLVGTNWVRTLLWTVRSAILGSSLWSALT